MRHHDEYADRMYLTPVGPAHIVPWSTQVALCGAMGNELDWYGTGDWDERETATAMALCEVCLKRAFPNDDDPSVRDWRSALGVS